MSTSTPRRCGRSGSRTRGCWSEHKSKKSLWDSSDSCGRSRSDPKRSSSHLIGAAPMTSIAKLYTRVRTSGHASFKDLRRIAEAFGFELKRTSGSHHIFQHPDEIGRAHV